MLRIPERFDGFEREFARKDKFLALDKTRPVEKIPPSAIYISPGGEVSEDFSPKEPILRPVSRRVLPEREYVTTAPSAIRIFAPRSIETKRQISTPARNFLDIFFDWLNKILSGK